MKLSILLTTLALSCTALGARAGTMYAIDSSRALYTIDIATGVKTSLGFSATANAGTTGGLARDPGTGTIYLTSTSTDSLYTLDLTTGTATLVAAYSDPLVVMHGLEFDCTGQLYGGSSGNLFTIDKVTGVVAQVGVSGLTSFLNLGYVPATDTLYATNSSTDSSYTVNRTTGALTLLSVMGAGVANPNGVAHNADNGLLYMVDNNTDTLYTIDQVTGLATAIGAHVGTSNLLGLVYVPTVADICAVGTPYCFGDGTGTACPCTPVPLVGDPDKGCPNSFNAGGGKLSGTGVAKISADTLKLTCTLINNGGAVIFQGTNDNGGGLGVAFGDGLRCAAGSVMRMKSHAVTTNSHQYPDPMFGDNPISVRGAVTAAGDRWYQGWYRSGLAHCDPAANYNLTNGLKVTWAP